MAFNRSGVAIAALSLVCALPVYAQQAPSAVPTATVPRVVRVDGQFVPANGLPPAAV